MDGLSLPHQWYLNYKQHISHYCSCNQVVSSSCKPGYSGYIAYTGSESCPFLWICLSCLSFISSFSRGKKRLAIEMDNLCWSNYDRVWISWRIPSNLYSITDRVNIWLDYWFGRICLCIRDYLYEGETVNRWNDLKISAKYYIYIRNPLFLNPLWYAE